MKQFREFPLFQIITVIGLLLFLTQSILYANSLDSIGDEGSYLYKGYMFARGDYRPYQEYTFWTNKSPLAFLIPGYIQLWFGPGLRVARYFSIVLGVVMLVGVWVTAQRLGGKVWAAIAVWVFALTSTQITIYSEAVSQVLVACMMAWMFVLTLGQHKPLWQLVLGSALSILIVMTRQNMVVLPVLLVLYIFWQYGKTPGLWALATCAIVFLVFHILYWPGILQIWAPWLPRSLTHFLDYYRVAAAQEQAASAVAVAGPLSPSRFQSFATGLHDNFFVFLGSASALVLFPKRADWKDPSRFKMAVFLGVTFFVLFLMHAWGSLTTNYCIYCFSGYQTFFSIAGLFFTLVVFVNGFEHAKSRVWLLVLVIVFFAANYGLHYYARWGEWLLDHVQLPRLNRLFSNGQFSTVSLRDVLTYSFNISTAPTMQERVIALLGGILLVVAFLGILWVLQRFYLQRNFSWNYSFINLVLFISLALGTIFPFSSSIQRVGRGRCGTNYLSYYESAGETLARVVPPGSLVYLRANGRQRALMLYLEDINIFPPQIHGGGGYVKGDSERLLRLGLYNEELDLKWRSAADILIFGERFTSPELFQFLEENRYEKMPYDIGALDKCEEALYVFRRTQ